MSPPHPPGGVAFRSGKRIRGGTHAVVAGGEGVGLGAEPGEGVHGGAMGRRRQQAVLLALPLNLHQGTADAPH